MSVQTRKFSTFIFISATVLLAGSANAAGPDSFFDVWTEVTFDTASNRPIVSARAAIHVPGTESQSVDTEIVSMQLNSHGSQDGSGPSKHVANVAYRVTNIGSSGLDGVGFMEVDITCQTDERGERSCVVDSTRPISRGEHRGHVTVLK
jgi:hypothetical protein